MSFGGFGGGAPMFGGGGGSRSAAAPGGGLPFAGIPPELQEGVDKLLDERARVPRAERAVQLCEHRRAQQAPEPAAADLPPLAPRRDGRDPGLHRQRRQPGRSGADLVRDRPRDAAASRLTWAWWRSAPASSCWRSSITALAQRSQARVTGRLAARVMNDLRVKVFTHLQRLGLDFYTEEKAGVIMTRMTSDIENLQQLLQDGLAQLVGQALTMVVITVILFTMNVELTLITLALVVPILTGGTIWFTRASQRGYERVRDGIAGVLGDLSESLHGVRTVAAFNRQRWNVVQHRNVVGVYRDANNYTAQINAIYGPGTQMLGYLEPGGAARDRRQHGAARPALDRCAGRVLPLPEPLLRADPAAGPAVQHLPAGAVVGAQAAHAVPRRSRAPRRSRTPRCCRRSRARSCSITSASATCPTSRCCATSTCGSLPARPSPSSGRRAPASPRPPS